MSQPPAVAIPGGPLDDDGHQAGHSDSQEDTRSMFGKEDDAEYIVVKRVKNRLMTEVEKRIEAWKKIFTAMGVQDDRLVESWKSEMDNLLIFSALYSAVVSAFVVDTVKLLVPDSSSSSTSNTLLEISHRIASYSLSDNFANSTHVLAPSSTTSSSGTSSSSTTSSSSDTVPSYAVKVNTLWFLSLTLSLIAAFFGIAIQQWLRHLRIPKHIPPRDAIRLRQLRYRGLMRWQVPIIVTLLPALVQISVILFLIGLIQYVRHSSHPVALPFTVVSSLSLVLFVIVSLVPLFEPSCPYKSPLVHITWNLGWVVAAICTIAVTLPLSMLVDCFSTKKHAGVSRAANRIAQFAEKYLLALQPPTTETSHFWTTRETESAGHQKGVLDQEALSWALTAGPKITDISCCLKDLHPSHRTRCVMEWISLKYDGHTDMYRMLYREVLGKRALEKVDKHFSQEFKDLLMDVLSDWPDKTGRKDDGDIPHVVMFLWKIVKSRLVEEGFDEFRTSFILHLLEVCQEREVDVEHAKSFLGWKATPRVPAVLLFDLLDLHKDDTLFGDKDVIATMEWAAKTSGVILSAQEHQEDAAAMFWFAPQEHILSCCAIALSLLVHHHTRTTDFKPKYQDHLRALLENLGKFLDKGANVLQRVLQQMDRLRDTEQGTLPTVTSEAIVSISRSLAQLRDDKILPLAANHCPSDLVQVEITRTYATFLLSASQPSNDGASSSENENEKPSSSHAKDVTAMSAKSEPDEQVTMMPVLAK